MKSLSQIYEIKIHKCKLFSQNKKILCSLISEFEIKWWYF